MSPHNDDKNVNAFRVQSSYRLNIPTDFFFATFRRNGWRDWFSSRTKIITTDISKFIAIISKLLNPSTLWNGFIQQQELKRNKAFVALSQNVGKIEEKNAFLQQKTFCSLDCEWDHSRYSSILRRILPSLIYNRCVNELRWICSSSSRAEHPLDSSLIRPASILAHFFFTYPRNFGFGLSNVSLVAFSNIYDCRTKRSKLFEKTYEKPVEKYDTEILRDPTAESGIFFCSRVTQEISSCRNSLGLTKISKCHCAR